MEPTSSRPPMYPHRPDAADAAEEFARQAGDAAEQARQRALASREATAREQGNQA